MRQNLTRWHILNSTLAQKRGARIPELDGLRGVAILLVIVWHYYTLHAPSASGPVADIARPFLGLTWSGVDLFFVLSGFLIGGILFDNQGARNYFKVFYTRRISRIVPLFYLAVAIYALVIFALPGLVAKVPQLFADRLPLWQYVTFTQNFAMMHAGSFGPRWLAVTWSLAVEEQFYILLPLVIRYVPARKLPYLLGCLILLAPFLRINLSAYYSDRLIPPRVMMPCRADALLLGVMCAFVMRQPGAMDYLAARLRYLYGIMAVLVAGVIWLATQSPQLDSFAMVIYGFTLLDLLYACLLLIAVTETRGLVTVITRNGSLRWCGFIAYGLYLFHEPINWLCHGVLLGKRPQLETPKGWLVTLTALATSFALASISWICFESPIVRLGHRLKYKGQETPAAQRSVPAVVGN